MANFVHLEEANQYLNIDLVWKVSVTREGESVTSAELQIVGHKDLDIVKGSDANNLATHLNLLSQEPRARRGF